MTPTTAHATRDDERPLDPPRHRDSEAAGTDGTAPEVTTTEATTTPPRPGKRLAVTTGHAMHEDE